MLSAETQSGRLETAIVRLPALTRSEALVAILLALVLLVGGYFRFVGQNWDGFTHLHPDERFLTQVVSAIGGSLNFTLNDQIDSAKTIQGQIEYCLSQYPDTNGIGGFFDARCSNYNPHNVGHGLYVYGTLPLFIAKIASTLVVQLTNDPVWAGYDGAHLVWRFVSAIADMGTILVIFFIGLRLHDKWVGLLAAALYATAPLAIQKAHFGTVNAMTTFFVALAILFAVRVQTRGRLFDYAAFGVAVSAALASRINVAPLVGLVVLAAVVRLMPVLDSKLPWTERQRLLLYHVGGLFLAGIVTIVTFRFFSPYTFSGPGVFGIIPNPRWLGDMSTARYLVSGEAESPPNWQWVARPGYLFPLWNMILWGMGLGLGLTAWINWLWSGYRLLRGKPGATRNLIPFAWVGVYFLFVGNLWVMSMRYYLPMYPALALLAAWGLVALVRYAYAPAKAAWRRWSTAGIVAAVVIFSYLWGMMFTNIYRHELTRVQASRWVWENVPGDFTMRLENSDAPIINIPVQNGFYLNSDAPLVERASQYQNGQSVSVSFVAPDDGVVMTVYAPHLGDPLDDPEPETIRITVTEAGDVTPLSETILVANLTREQHLLGNAYTLMFNRPLVLQKDHAYVFIIEVVDGGPVIGSGAVTSWEGSWDDPVPVKVCQLPPGITFADDPPPGLVNNARECRGMDPWSGLLTGYEMEMIWDDGQIKRDRMIEILDNTDYIVIGSNRFYDAESRIPTRWPMTLRYYDALFGGELGFELVGQFDETFEFGPFRASDQYLPNYDAPQWLNEFEAEEAFHVYDHPAVFIFRKSEAYTPQNMRDILYSVPLNQVTQVKGGFNCPTDPENQFCDPQVIGLVPLYGTAPDAAPTYLQLSPEMRRQQYDNGTWSSRFQSDSAINIQPLFTVVGWWMAMLVIGWVTWPLLFTLLPGLADRGYGFAKFGGLLLVGWFAWFASSARIPLWSQSGLVLVLLLLAMISALMGWRNRALLVDYVRQHRRRLMWIEIITLLAFLGFLVIRLTNPDLWHPSFGGEKPMDFAYFNGVLRSTIFPPIDPWYAGGYINYYYFGYVIVGVPVLLLGVMPSIAYNLIIPTLFALTGMAAFSVAFNLVSAWWERASSRPSDALETTGRRFQPANPWLAGIAALMLAVVLGNLDTPRVFVAEALLNTGFYRQPTLLQEQLVKEYAEQNSGLPPDDQTRARLVSRALEESESVTASIRRGLNRMLSGEPLAIAPNRWYWAPTRILSEPPVDSGGAIAEFPFFTFLYGDLHAHMINMPLLLLIVLFLLNELLLTGEDRRGRLERALALFLGALSVGLVRATNTWDWPSFLLFGVVGLTYCWWLAWKRFNRWSLLVLAARVGGFVVLSFALVFPYTAWYAATYNSIALWTGRRTPLWAYLDIHGLFLFLIVSLLVWDTGRWFRSVHVRSLRGTAPLLVAIFIAAVIVALGVVFLSISNYQVSLVAIPLILWIGVLFFRRGQTRPMQFALVLAGFALAMTLGVEFIVIGGDIGRQNTVFKFYIQAWLLFSVVGGVAFAALVQSTERWSNGLRGPWFALAGLLVIVAAMYPIMASRGRALDRMGAGTPFTLDGMEYMNYSQQGENGVWFPLADDYNIIRWLQENTEGTPVIMEGQSQHEYLWSSRIAIYTGLPSIVGWNFHQLQQRTFDPMPRLVTQRRNNVNAFYVTADIPTAWDILRYYDVHYIVVSGLEKAYYPEEGLAKFDQMVRQGLLEIAYQEGGATIYKVNREAFGAGTAVASRERGQ